MRPDVVVVVAPQGQLSAGIGQAVEDLLVQAFVAQAAIEGLDVAVLLRLAGIDVMPFDAVLVGPLQDRLDRKSTRLNSSHRLTSRMPSSA